MKRIFIWFSPVFVDVGVSVNDRVCQRVKILSRTPLNYLPLSGVREARNQCHNTITNNIRFHLINYACHIYLQA